MKTQRKRLNRTVEAAVAAAMGTNRSDRHMKRLVEAGPKYSVILSDSPWNYGRSSPVNSGKAAPQNHYPCMSTEDIAALPIKQIAAPNAVLALWAVNSMLPDALRVMKAYGFKYKTHIVWAKPNHCPTSGLVLPTHEVLLIGYRGKGVKRAAGQPCIRSCFTSPKNGPRLRHSEKPEHFAKEIERVFPDARKIELFARVRRRGWTTWGNQSSPGTSPLSSSGRKRTQAGQKSAVGVTASRRGRGRTSSGATSTKGGRA